MTVSLVRMQTPRATPSFVRSRRVRRFWGSMSAALRYTAAPSGKPGHRVTRELRGYAVRGM
ncbi:MAG TPA: hypothetical protein VFG44_04415 [Burkholderiales bacterium]|nr:hypothetical protein [Burkholderiales bacterium]